MRLSAVVTAIALLSVASLTIACSNSGGVGGTDSAFYYPAPVNYDPGAGLSPDLTDPRTGGPSSPPFRP